MGVGEWLLTLRGPIWPPRCYCWKAAGQLSWPVWMIAWAGLVPVEGPGVGPSVGQRAWYWWACSALPCSAPPLGVQIALQIIQITIWTAERRKACAKSALSLTNLRWCHESRSWLSCPFGSFLPKSLGGSCCKVVRARLELCSTISFSSTTFQLACTV